jgi:hypothetical protein
MRRSGALAIQSVYLKQSECSNPRVVGQEAGDRYMDLVSLMTAKRLELAKAIDQGKPTETQTQLEFAPFMTAIIDRERQRDRERR